MSFRASGNSDISIIYLSESVAESECPTFSSPGAFAFFKLGGVREGEAPAEPPRKKTLA